jgi:hypothetical protein
LTVNKPLPASLRATLDDAGVSLGDCIEAFAAPEDHPAVVQARRQHEPGTLEVGEPTFVAEMPSGAYVLAWLWVPYPIQTELPL